MSRVRRRRSRRKKCPAATTDEVAWRCQNIAGCPAQLTRRVEYFAQRKALDLESLGGIVAEKLVERGLVKEPLDLFDLKLEPLGKLNLGTDDEPRTFGEKNATKILDALQRAKTAPLSRWIHALAIADVGEATAKQLAATHESLEALADSEVLRDIRDLGAKESERAEISPRSRKNPPKNEAEKAAREKRDAELKAEIAALEARLEAGGLKAKLVEVGPVAAASVLDYFRLNCRERKFSPASANWESSRSAEHRLGSAVRWQPTGRDGARRSVCRQNVCADRHPADADARGSDGED